MTLTLKQKEQYLRDRSKVKQVILETLRNEKAFKPKVYGAKADNKKPFKHLKEHTMDYDIATKQDPRRLARVIERNLDKKFKGNYFELQRTQYPGGYKIVSRVSQKGVADVTPHLKEKMRTIRRNGVNYATLEFQKRRIKASLSRKQDEYRLKKDKFTKLRIKLAEKKKKVRKVSKRRAKRKLVRKQSKWIPQVNLGW